MGIVTVRNRLDAGAQGAGVDLPEPDDATFPRSEGEHTSKMLAIVGSLGMLQGPAGNSGLECNTHARAGLSRRSFLPLPLAAFGVPLAAHAADTFEFVENGVTKQMTEMEARDALTKKVEAATAAGKGIDMDRRGQFNEKALFSEDFYFKYGLRPDPEEVLKSPFLPPQAELPFAPVKRRYEGYSKYKDRIQKGIVLYGEELRDLVKDAKWAEIGPALEKGAKSKGNSKDGAGTGVAASDLRSSCRAYGLFANTVLQSENDSGSTTANLLARHLVNEVYFSMDDLADAAKAGDKKAATVAWNRGKAYLNGYLRIVNFPISSKVGDKFPLVETTL